MIPIVFIHGFGGGAYEFQPIIKFLKKNKIVKFYEFTYDKNWGEVSIKDIAREFDLFVNKNIKEKVVNIIGISQGGIIARLFLQKNNSLSVKKLITLCTPHSGSLLAYLWSSPGFIDLRPGSKVLKLINGENDNVIYYSVYNSLDLMVFPGTNAKFGKAKKNKMVISLLHPLTFWAKPTLKFILTSLNDKD